MKESKAMMKKEVSFMKKKGAPKSMIKHEESEMKGMKKMRGGGQSAPQRGGIGSMISGGVGANQPQRMRGGGTAYSGGGGVYRKAADGVASKGKTKGKMVAMRMGGKC